MKVFATEAEAEAVLARAVVGEALDWVGTPYRHQASRKGVGCDCLGLLRGVWRALYGFEPEDPGPYSADWAETGKDDRLLNAARRCCRERAPRELAAGHVIILRWRPHLPAKHVGILTAPGQFVHAYQGSRVVVSALVPQWRRRIAGVFAFPPLPNA
ncbi:NlpC/P60 family protein [Nitratireductor sp. ZSWI3]|uniref:NlpC/P60 family protein n=1 Tax=Nitratireductor sp. ZSWI3 TaxID=2966359 RepID=UPI00214F7801|nr:NlpC/P60 family protein [Nitratireductor sp. ZSWI3]MCR4269221.1 NlpC/P60 family protein [Nitratireductor sp. ZSWI3]